MEIPGMGGNGWRDSRRCCAGGRESRQDDPSTDYPGASSALGDTSNPKETLLLYPS